MRKVVIIFLVALLCLSMASAFEYNLLNKKEKVTAEAIPITTADVVTVAKIEGMPWVYYCIGILLAIYAVLSYLKIKWQKCKDIAEGLRFYRKFISHIIRLALGLWFLWIALHPNFFLKYMPLIPRIICIVAGTFILAGVLLRYTSTLSMLLVVWMFLEGWLQGLNALEVIGLLVVLAVHANSPISVDHLLKLTYKPFAFLEEHVFGLIRIVLGSSFVGNAWVMIEYPQYALMLVNKLGFLSTMTTSPESLIMRTAGIQAVVGVMLIIGFLQRFHSLVALIMSTVLFFAVETQGLSLLPTMAAAIVLVIAGPHEWSVDAVLDKMSQPPEKKKVKRKPRKKSKRRKKRK